MALKNRSMYAILGILSLSPSTGYDVKQYSDTVLASFWHENFGHIYPTLKRLLEEGMIEVAPCCSDEKKTVYAITGAGWKEFTAWLRETTVPQPVRSEFMLKLLFSSALSQAEVIAALQTHKAQQKERLALYRGMQDCLLQGIPSISNQRAVFLKAVLRSGILAAETAVRWCDETVSEMQSMTDWPSIG